MLETTLPPIDVRKLVQETTYPLEARVPPLSSIDIRRITPYELGPFRPRRLLVPSDVAPHFLVTDVKVGHNSQTICPTAIPASFFDEARPPTDLYFDLLPPNRFFTVSVTNTSPEEKTFRCRVAGVHDPSKMSPHLQNTVMGLGYTLARPETPRILLRVQPQVVFHPHRLYVPERVLESFRVESLGIQRAFLKPPTPQDHYPVPDSPPDYPTHADADPSSLTSEKLLVDGTVNLPVAGCGDFVKLVATLTADRPVPFCGALVGTMFR